MLIALQGKPPNHWRLLPESEPFASGSSAMPGQVAPLPPPPLPSGGRGAHTAALRRSRDRIASSARGSPCRQFPRVKATLGDGAWRALVRAFNEEDRSTASSPTGTAKSFVAFLRRREASGIDPSWLPELAHHEHVKLLLERADPPIDKFRANGDLLDGIPVLSLVVPLAYRWPVDIMGPDLLPGAAPAAATLLLARRDARRCVHFVRVSAFDHALLVSLSTNRWPGRKHLIEFARSSRREPSHMLMLGQALLEQLRRDGIVLGTRVEPHLGIDRHHRAMDAASGT